MNCTILVSLMITEVKGDTMPDSAETKAKLHDIAEDVKTVLKILNGNGDPSKGLVVRVDRLEQSESRRNWLSRSAIGACIVGIITMIVRLFRGF